MKDKCQLINAGTIFNQLTCKELLTSPCMLKVINFPSTMHESNKITRIPPLRTFTPHKPLIIATGPDNFSKK